jgi:hypothetical protein
MKKLKPSNDLKLIYSTLIVVLFALISCKKNDSPSITTTDINCEIIPYRKGDLWGIMLTSGSMLIEPQYDDIYLMADGYAHIRLNNKEGLVNPKGEILVSPKYEYVSMYYEGRSAFRLGEGLQGYLDESGREVIPPIYDFTGEFVHNRAFVKADEEYILIDRNGVVIKKLKGMEPYYQDYFESLANIQPDANAILVTKSANFQVGILDSMGNSLLPTSYN